jgi:hypothetical protein
VFLLRNANIPETAEHGCCITSIAVGPESARWFVDRHPRLLADITGDGRADIVAFGDTGVWTAISNGDGTFAVRLQ